MTKAIRWTEEELAAFQGRSSVARPAVKAGQAAANKAAADMLEDLAKPRKYRNAKVVQDGITHDSKREARRWDQLRQLERAGDITELRRQVSYELIPKQQRADGKAERACSYVADFAYIRGGLPIVEDAKGMRTRDYVIKRKLMLRVHGITVFEV